MALPELETLVLREMQDYYISLRSEFYCPKLKYFDALKFKSTCNFAEPCSLLKTLILAHSYVNDHDVKELCKSKCLEVIDLSGTNITDMVFENDDVACLQSVDVTACLDFTTTSVLRIVMVHANTLRSIRMCQGLYERTCAEYPFLFHNACNIKIHTCNHNEGVCACTLPDCAHCRREHCDCELECLNREESCHFHMLTKINYEKHMKKYLRKY